MSLENNIRQANNEIIAFCKRYNRNDKLIEYIIMFTKNRVGAGKIYDLFNKDIYVELNYIESYWILKAIKGYYNNVNPVAKTTDKIRLNDYIHFYKSELIFTEVEIQNAERYYSKTQRTDTIIFDNIYQVEEDLFTCIRMSFKTISKLFNFGIVNYNFASQREAKIIDAKVGEYLYAPTVYKDHVQDIKNNMQQDTFFANHVVFNILDNGEQLFEYNEKNHTLTFTRNAMSQMNILDGFHRCSAINELVAENPDIDGYIQANIFVMNVEQAQNYILQESKASPINAEHKQELKKTVENEILKNINNAGSLETSKIFHKIGANIEEIKKYHIKFANMIDMSKVISDVFDKELIKKFEYKNKITMNLKDLFNFWIDLNEDDFSKMYKNKNYADKNFKTTSQMFCMLIYIYSKYFNLNLTEKIYDDLRKIEEDLNCMSLQDQKLFFRSNLTRSTLYRVIDKYVDFHKYLPIKKAGE